MPDMSVKVRGSTDGEPIEIFKSRLDVAVTEFCQDKTEEELSKPTTFLALLKYLYCEFFRPDHAQRYNMKSVLGSEAPEVIEKIWDWYCSLSLRFGRTPTVLQFCFLTGFNKKTFATWRAGEYRVANNKYSDTAQKMYDQAEAALESRAVESNAIGAIFGLKACHQWREAAPIMAEATTQAITESSPEEISARYASAQLPEEKPDI